MAAKALTLNETAAAAAELRGHRNRKWVTKKESAAVEQRAFLRLHMQTVELLAKLSLG